MAPRARTSPAQTPPTRRRVTVAPGTTATPEQPRRAPEEPPSPQAPPPARRELPARSPRPTPVPEPPTRRKRVVAGLAAEASAQAEARRNGHVGAAGPTVPARRNGVPAPVSTAGKAMLFRGTCPCGLPASTRCVAGCGRPMCGEHLLNRSSRLGWTGPYRSEREHTAYLRAFWANAAALCAWCREAAGTTALAALLPVAPLPSGVLERLTFLLRHPHDYPREAWDETVRQHGGSAAVLRLAAPRVAERKSGQEFDGRRKGELLAGVSVGGCSGTQTTYEVLDRAGGVWTVRPLGSGIMRKRRAWAWEPVAEERVAQLLPRILEMAAL